MLTDIVQLLRPRTALIGALRGSGRWGVAMPNQSGPTFFMVVEGRCWFRAGEGDLLELNAGDYLLSPRPDRAVFLSDPSARPDFVDDAFKARNTIDGELVLKGDGPEPPCRIQGGVVLCDSANADLLVGLLPRLIHVRASQSTGRHIAALTILLAEEARGAEPGREAILSRLIEVMLIATLRSESTELSAKAGVARALADPRLARALSSIHADVARGWSVTELAEIAGMSRSTFFRRFNSLVGLAPVEYLLAWRMALAKDALARNRARLDEIATSVGYQSASAFSTAFSRRVGCPPSVYAAAQA